MANERVIFIVDDDHLYSQMLVDHLSVDPVNVVKAFTTGEACLEKLFESPDFIILDYHLNMVDKKARNGLEILEQIRKANQQAKVIMLSSQERYGVALQTISKGAEQYIVKDKLAFQKIDQIIKS